MKVSFKAQHNGTHVSVVYAVGGHDPDNFEEISKGVDAVLGEQMKRYGVLPRPASPDPTLTSAYRLIVKRIVA